MIFFEEACQNLWQEELTQFIFTFISYRFIFSVLFDDPYHRWIGNAMKFVIQTEDLMNTNMHTYAHMINWHSINRSFTLQIVLLTRSPICRCGLISCSVSIRNRCIFNYFRSCIIRKREIANYIMWLPVNWQTSNNRCTKLTKYNYILHYQRERDCTALFTHVTNCKYGNVMEYFHGGWCPISDT